jgi:hypothetical protein
MRWPADDRVVYACNHHHSPQQIREAWIDFGFDGAPARELELSPVMTSEPKGYPNRC